MSPQDRYVCPDCGADPEQDEICSDACLEMQDADREEDYDDGWERDCAGWLA